MRPGSLEGFVGHASIVGPGTVLRQAIEGDRPTSLIFWGPPGSGKTTLARIIAVTTKAHFEQLSAVSAGVADVRRLIQQAGQRLVTEGRRTVVFIDEIHRFNKAQQDALLPAVEDGTISLIGATTENPYFEVISALVSRCRIFRLEALSDDQVRELAERALADQDRGLARLRPQVDPAALDHLIATANGDARTALNALELAVLTTEPDGSGVRHVDLVHAIDVVQRRASRYDKLGDQHFDTASALIKSMRGSDPDAAVYWLARMIDAGEDAMFIARRIVICAAEDVGNADPRALLVATAAAQATAMIGLPEARIPLAQAAIYVACAPKSNASCVAIDAALSDVREAPPGAVPLHLRNAPHPRLAADHGYGVDYKYPHDFAGHTVAQAYLPPELVGRIYYRPSATGEEAETAARNGAKRGLTAGSPGDTLPSEGKDYSGSRN
jgi:putative ATPase